MRTLITGGTGFVGRSIIESYKTVETGSLGIVTVTSRTPQRFSQELVTHSLWDVLEECPLQPNFDVIIHAATTATADNPLDSEIISNMEKGTKNVIEFAQRHSVPPRLVLLSSGAVYGEMPSAMIDFPEDFNTDSTILSNNYRYALGKRALEIQAEIANANGKVPCVIARLFAFSGRHLPLNRHFAIGNFVLDALTSGEITVRSDGKSVRSYLDSYDMAHWLRTIALDGQPGHIYHVGSERQISIADLASLVASRVSRFVGAEVPVHINGTTSTTDGVARYVPSTAKTRSELNLSETVSLEESIDNMISEWRSP